VYLKLPRAEVIVQLGEIDIIQDFVEGQSSSPWIVQAHTALVPGRTKRQCHHKWGSALDPSVDRANRRTDKWREDEDIKLKNGVQLHGGKNWAAIVVLVPGRTQKQCRNRWHTVMNTGIDCSAID
jgi:hypothetical protein